MKNSAKWLAGKLGAVRAFVPARLAESLRNGAPALLWQDPLDTRWAVRDPRFSRVVHVFHQEWHGIRAAAGYSPGLKLGIPAERRLGRAGVAAAVEACLGAKPSVVVLQGFSDNAHALAQALRSAGGKGLRVCAVYHGNTAQFHFDYEYRQFAALVSLKRSGVVDAIGCVKPDMHLVVPDVHARTLVNFPPAVEPVATRAGLTGTALLPVPNDWRKNFFTNVYAAERIPRIRRLVVTTPFEQPPQLAGSKVLVVERQGREQIFRLVAGADVVLNATLSECQPMTALEALVLRVPCVTGALGLGALDRHPYQQLAQVAAVDTVGAVRDAAERFLDLRERSPQELDGMMADYERKLREEASARFREFLEL